MYFENCKLSDKLYNRFLLLPITALHVLSLFIIIYSKRTKKNVLNVVVDSSLPPNTKKCILLL